MSDKEKKSEVPHEDIKEEENKDNFLLSGNSDKIHESEEIKKEFNEKFSNDGDFHREHDSFS
ncbi:MAG: hypothetical protein WCX46_00705 [Candidatus Paceibacterota bacterium]